MGNCMQKRKIKTIEETDNESSQLEVAGRQSFLYTPLPLGEPVHSHEKIDQPTESPLTKRKITELTAENELLRDRIRMLEARVDNENMIDMIVEERLKKRMEELNESATDTVNCSYEVLGSQTALITSPISSTHHERRKFTKSPILYNAESPCIVDAVEQDENLRPSTILENTLATTPKIITQSVNETVDEADDEMSLARLRAASLSSEEEDCCPEAYRTNRDERPVLSLPTPIRLNQVSPSTLEKFVDKAGRPQRKKINRLMQLRNGEQ